MKTRNIFAILITILFSFSLQIFAQDNAKLLTAKEIFQKYADAIGGKSAVEKITSRTYKGTLEIPAMNINGTFEMFYKAPNKNLVSLALKDFGENLNGFDGTVAWAKDAMQGLRTKSNAELEHIKVTSDFYYSVNLENVYPNAETTGTQKIENKEVYMVKADANATLYFDKETGFLLKSERLVISPQGKMLTTTSFSDYREIDGIKYPHTWRQSIHGGEMILKIAEIKHNAEIDEAIFSKPKGD